MTVGIIGLGLIGGSFARAYKKAGNTVFGMDKNENVLNFARISNVIDGNLDKGTIGKCNLILIALFPEAAREYLTENSPFISKGTLVIDCCGIKNEICKTGFALAEKYGFTFVGGHPMAGTHNSGFKYSRANMFSGAPMVIVPPVFDDAQLLSEIEQALKPANFGKFSVTTAENHDKMIAFTSQMAHIVSNAFIKSPTAGAHEGFSAGSYKDLTRVAWLNPALWTDLFLENSDNLIKELDIFIDNIKKYRDAIDGGDYDGLYSLLDEGKRCKEKVDG
ncbi:MAG: prephenate dehydrogenase [Bacillota bacterium]|nr:prephenate dehydrogenase [Bacillota bacterium]